jgi:hypothetical protein
MNRSIHTKQVAPVLIITIVLVCFGLMPEVQAVIPPPDGCYPGYTTAEGCNTLQSLTIGLGNTGVGWYSLFGNSIGSYNTAIGAGALDLNNADSNTATGAAALLLNTTGHDNTSTGVDALALNNIGIQNTADGAFALFNNTTGGSNIAIGFYGGSALTTGNNNIDIGNIGVAGESNTIRIGDPAIHTGIFVAGISETSPAPPNQAVLVNLATGHLGSVSVDSFGVVTTSPENTAVGDQALFNNMGALNSATGFHALFTNTTGEHDTATGAEALQNNTTGDYNDAVGAQALLNNVDGFTNNAFGDSALLENVHAAGNTAIGDLALQNNDSSGNAKANSNTAVGAQALFSNVDGDSNNAFGYNALGNNTVGLYNQALGFGALSGNVDGSANVGVGDSAMAHNMSGSYNTMVGDMVAPDLTLGSDDIYIGATSGNGVTSESGTIRIGDPDFVVACYVAGIDGQTVSGGAAVFVDANGKLGTVTSSARFKENIQPMERASESIFALKPVTFRYKKAIDPQRVPQFGLVAEDVEKVNPDLVLRDKGGKPYSVRYDQVNAMLLNEFLKEHRKVEQMQKQIDALIAGLQKVRAQVELSRPAPQTVLNNQ